MNNAILSLQNINHSFSNQKVIKDVSFEVHKNEFVSLVGPSGCGKSTLFKILTSIIQDYSGSIMIHGKNISDFSDGIGYMPQKDLLLPWRTLTENIILPLEIAKKDIDLTNIVALIETFGLKGFEHHYPHQLSGGMKQRSALLRTFLMGKDIILLDEPFASIDYLTKRKLQKWLKETLVLLNKTVLFITHDIDEAILLSDRIISLSSLPASKLKEFSVSHIKSQESDLAEFMKVKTELLALIEST